MNSPWRRLWWPTVTTAERSGLGPNASGLGPNASGPGRTCAYRTVTDSQRARNPGPKTNAATASAATRSDTGASSERERSDRPGAGDPATDRQRMAGSVSGCHSARSGPGAGASGSSTTPSGHTRDSPRRPGRSPTGHHSQSRSWAPAWRATRWFDCRVRPGTSADCPREPPCPRAARRSCVDPSSACTRMFRTVTDKRGPDTYSNNITTLRFILRRIAPIFVQSKRRQVGSTGAFRPTSPESTSGRLPTYPSGISEIPVPRPVLPLIRPILHRNPSLKEKSFQ